MLQTTPGVETEMTVAGAMTMRDGVLGMTNPFAETDINE